MVIDFKTPIECPNCHKPLRIVQINMLKVFEWGGLMKKTKKVREGS